MPYALVPIIDVGPSHLPWVSQQRMPLGLDQGGNCIHLGPDHALLWTPNPIADVRAETLADDSAETLTASRGNLLATVAGDGRAFPVGRRQFGQAVRDLLVNAPPRWASLVSTQDGRLEAYLGPGGIGANVLFRETVAPRGPHSKDIQDTFNRADAALSGSTSSDAQFTWSLPQGTSARLNIVSNQVVASRAGTNVFNVVLASLAMDTADHYCQAALVSLASSEGPVALEMCVRITNGTGSGDSGYAFAVTSDAGVIGTRRVYNFVTDATIASDGTLTTSGTMYLELSGSTYTAKVDAATVFTGTNTAYPGTGSQRKAAFTTYVPSNDLNTLTLDNFRAADLGAGGGVTDGWKILLH